MKTFNRILASIFCILSLACSQAFAAGDNGWVLTQHSKAFGDQYLYISTRGVKCFNPKQGIGWITQAPNWNITFFNEKTAVFYPLSSATWKKKMVQNGLIPSNINWSKVSSGSIAGLKATKYQMTNNVTNQETNSKAKWQSAIYWLADNINVPASLSQLISIASGLPASDSVPLQLSYRNQNGQSDTLLSTYHQQSCTIPDSYFYLPRSYKIAKNEVEVLMSQENKSLLNDLANDLSHDNSPVRGNSPASIISKQHPELSLDKMPNQVALPGGKTVTKEQVSNFLKQLKETR